MKKNIDEIPVLTSAQIRGASTFAQRRQAKRGSGDGYHLITDFRGRLSAYDFRQNLASFPARSSSSHYTN